MNLKHILLRDIAFRPHLMYKTNYLDLWHLTERPKIVLKEIWIVERPNPRGNFTVLTASHLYLALNVTSHSVRAKIVVYIPKFQPLILQVRQQRKSEANGCLEPGHSSMTLPDLDSNPLLPCPEYYVIAHCTAKPGTRRELWDKRCSTEYLLITEEEMWHPYNVTKWF